MKETITTVEGALRYLLEHDADDWSPFLCSRLTKMCFDRGVISQELWQQAREWIEARISPQETLSSYHYAHVLQREHKKVISAVDPAWAAVRRSYLEQWIAELAACTRKTS